MQIQYCVDARGLVIGPRIHDGWLRGIEDVPDGGLLIKCRRSDGVNVTFSFEDAILLSVTDFVFGNIVDSLFRWQLLEAPDQVKDFLLWNLGEDAPNFWSRLSIEQPDAYLFSLECSFGATVAILAKRLAIHDEAKGEGGA